MLLLFLVTSAGSSEAAGNPSGEYNESANAACQPLQTYPDAFSQLGMSVDSASNAQLLAAGLPPRPVGDSEALAAWQTAMADARTYEAPDPLCSTNVHSPVYTGIWAGHVAPNTDFGNVNFTWSQSQWVQPSVLGDSSYPAWTDAPDTSFWTGIGETSLIQAGADSIASSTPVYKFWTEDYPAGTTWEGPAIVAGQSAYAYVEYLGNNKAYYFLENLNSGGYSPFTNAAPYVGWRDANFINERVNGLYLPAFSNVAVTNNYFGTSTSTWGLTSNFNQINVMTSNCLSSGSVLSYPSGVDSSGNFNQVWYSSSPFDNGC
jgi:hypothetical protein